MTRPSVYDLSKGKWPALLPQLGVSRDFLTGRHGPCPTCAGRDRFRFDDKGEGLSFCSQCGSRKGVQLVMDVNSWDFKTAAQAIERLTGSTPAVAVRHGPSEEAVRKEMNGIWKAAKPIGYVRATALWWAKRCGQIPEYRDLRGIESLHCPGAGNFPGMLALVRDAEGKPVNMHRTFLTHEGGKAPIPDCRRIMPMPLPKGSAVRLVPHGEVLGVAEGIETAEAARILFDVPTWALLNANNMTGFVPPEGVRRLVIFGDTDTSFTGQAAAFELAKKIYGQREKLKIEVEVQLHGVSISPSAIGTDWNDVLMEKLGDREGVPA